MVNAFFVGDCKEFKFYNILMEGFIVDMKTILGLALLTNCNTAILSKGKNLAGFCFFCARNPG